LPAGIIGVRIGLLGFALMAVCLVTLNNVADVTRAVPLLALAVLFVPRGASEADTGPDSGQS